MLIVDSINYNVINECIDIPYLKYFFFYFYDCLLPAGYSEERRNSYLQEKKNTLIKKIKK